VVDSLQDVTGLGVERPAGLRDRHVSLAASEKRHLQLALERDDLLAQRRLHDPQSLSGTPEVQLLGHGNEVAEMPELHGKLIVRVASGSFRAERRGGVLSVD
jgi:hypothetical protein